MKPLRYIYELSAGKITRDGELDLEEEANFKASRFHRKQLQMPPTSVITRLVFIMVWRKLIRNPSTYASVLGLIWSLIAFRYLRKFQINDYHTLIIAYLLYTHYHKLILLDNLNL